MNYNPFPSTVYKREWKEDRVRSIIISLIRGTGLGPKQQRKRIAVEAADDAAGDMMKKNDDANSRRELKSRRSNF